VVIQAAPMIKIKTDKTVEKTGRRMKKLEMERIMTGGGEKQFFVP